MTSHAGAHDNDHNTTLNPETQMRWLSVPLAEVRVGEDLLTPTPKIRTLVRSDRGS